MLPELSVRVAGRGEAGSDEPPAADEFGRILAHEERATSAARAEGLAREIAILALEIARLGARASGAARALSAQLSTHLAELGSLRATGGAQRGAEELAALSAIARTIGALLGADPSALQSAGAEPGKAARLERLLADLFDRLAQLERLLMRLPAA